MEEKTEGIFVRVPSEVRKKWLEMTATTGKQQDAFASLIQFLYSLDRDVREALLSGDRTKWQGIVGTALAKSALIERIDLKDGLGELNYQELFDIIEAASRLLEERFAALRHAATGKLDPPRKK